MTTYLATPDPGDVVTLAVRDQSPVAEDFEDFGTSTDPPLEGATDNNDSFEVRLARTERAVHVMPGVSILEALHEVLAMPATGATAKRTSCAAAGSERSAERVEAARFRKQTGPRDGYL